MVGKTPWSLICACPFPVIPSSCAWLLSSKRHRCANGTCRKGRQSRLVTFAGRQHRFGARCCQVFAHEDAGVSVGPSGIMSALAPVTDSTCCHGRSMLVLCVACACSEAGRAMLVAGSHQSVHRGPGGVLLVMTRTTAVAQ